MKIRRHPFSLLPACLFFFSLEASWLIVLISGFDIGYLGLALSPLQLIYSIGIYWQHTLHVEHGRVIESVYRSGHFYQRAIDISGEVRQPLLLKLAGIDAGYAGQSPLIARPAHIVKLVQDSDLWQE